MRRIRSSIACSNSATRSKRSSKIEIVGSGCRRSRFYEAAHSWAIQHNYESIRLECHNQHRPLLHLAIALGYDIVGMRWDADRTDNLVLFEKSLTGGR